MTAVAAQAMTFHIEGMHCKACVLLIDSELAKHPRVASARSSLRTRSVEVRGDFGDRPPEDVARELSDVLSQHSLSTAARASQVDWSEFGVAVPIALACAALFVLLQQLGVVNLVTGDGSTYGTAFLVGVVASLSTCMAIVGGLVLSISATFARSGDNTKPQTLFHAGRIVSFLVLGGVIGLIGSAFQLGSTSTFALTMLVALFMLALGINLLGIFRWSGALLPSMPKFLSEKALGTTRLTSTIAPAMIGAATFFLPCGFTQSMQLYAVSTGSALSGALTMLFFALGTLPALGLLSFSSLTIRGGANQGVFFKTAGLLVILFAVFNAVNGLAAMGWIDPVFNW